MSMVVVTMGASEVFAQEYVLKFGLLGPEGSSWADMAYSFKDLVREKTHGEVSIKVYPGGSMGDEPELVQKMRLGQLQTAGLTAMGLSKIAPETEVLSLPFLFRDYDEVDYVLDKTFPLFKKVFEEKGFIFIGWTEVGFAYIFSQIPLKTEKDLHSVRIWTWQGDSLLSDTLKSVGFNNVVPLSFLDVLASLQTGLINAFYLPLYPCIGFQWFTQAKYMTDFFVFYTPAGVVIDKKAFNLLPPGFQRLALTDLKSLLRTLIGRIRQDETASLHALEAHGIRQIHPSSEFISSLREKAYPLYEKYSGTAYPSWLFNGIKQSLNEYRARKP